MTRLELGPADFGGLMAMMPAFATPDAADEYATDTVDADETVRAVDRIVVDGADVITTTGSFGEFHTLLPDEHAALVAAAVKGAGRRVPVIAGCVGLNTREVLARVHAAVDAGADGVLVGVPFYFPATQANALRFLEVVAAAHPTVPVMIYHNPTLHDVHLSVQLLADLIGRHPNVMATKDSHRDTREFAHLRRELGDRLSVFVAAWQYEAYHRLGARGFWTYDCWMDPRPVLELRRAVAAGEYDWARELTLALHPVPPPGGTLSWRETLAKIAIGKAHYCVPGPLRPPFVEIPADVEERAAARAQRWLRLADMVGAGQWRADPA